MYATGHFRGKELIKQNGRLKSLFRFKKSDSDSSMESSDTESEHSDSEMKIDESYNSFKHHNGFTIHEHTNGHHHYHHQNNSLADSENRHNSNNDKVYCDVRKAIKNFGFREYYSYKGLSVKKCSDPRKIYRRLCELETENEDDVRHHIRKLMVDAIRFNRPELLTMLEGYKHVDLSQEKTATSEPQLPRIL